MTVEELAEQIDRIYGLHGGTPTLTMLQEGYTFCVSADQLHGWWTA